MIKRAFFAIVFGALSLSAVTDQGQATTRLCGSDEAAGPACLIVHKEIGALPAEKVYWHVDTEQAAIFSGTSLLTLLTRFCLIHILLGS